MAVNRVAICYQDRSLRVTDFIPWRNLKNEKCFIVQDNPAECRARRKIRCVLETLFSSGTVRVLHPFRELTDPCKGPQFGAETWLLISQLMSESFRTVLAGMKILCLLFGQQTVKTMDPKTSEYPPGISCWEQEEAGSLMPAAEEASPLERDTVLTICLTALQESHWSWQAPPWLGSTLQESLWSQQAAPWPRLLSYACLSPSIQT